MKKFILLVLTVSLMTLLSGCNAVARSFGGSQTINLPKGQKLVNVTWKEDSAWFLTKPMSQNDVEETYTFNEDSNFGVLEGTLTIIEHK